MKKLWIFHSSNELYGSDRVLLEIVAGLDKSQWEVRVIVPADLEYEPVLSQHLAALGVIAESRPLAVLRRRYQTPRGLLTLGWLLLISVPKLAWQVRRQKVSLAYTNTGVVLSGAIAAKLAGTPHVWGLKELMPRGKIGKLLGRLYQGLSRTIVVTSAAVSQSVLSANARCEPKIKLIQNSVDIEKFKFDAAAGQVMRAKLNLEIDAVVTAMIGRVAQSKGPEVFIEAARLLQPQFPQARFLIVGGPVPGEENYLQSLQTKVKALNLSEVVRFVEFQPKIKLLLNATNIVAIPSLRPEGFGLTAIEGMAMGCAIVAAGHGGPLETIEQGVNGLLYSPPNDAQALASCLQPLLSNAELRRAMGEQGRRIAKEKFSRENEIAAYCRLFVESLN